MKKNCYEKRIMNTKNSQKSKKEVKICRKTTYLFVQGLESDRCGTVFGSGCGNDVLD